MKNHDEESSQSSRPVTMQDIADRAKVTRALVSMAMRNSPKVAVATRHRIQSLARQMGYRSDPMIRALMSKVRQGRKSTYRATLAFITNLPTADYWKKLDSYPGYFLGAQKSGQRLGYQVEHFWLGHYRDKPARLADIFSARGIPGVLIAPLPHSDHRFSMDLTGFSAVTFGYSLKQPDIPRVCNNHVQTVQMAVERLVRCGYRHIGFAVSKEDVRQVNYLWRAGLCAAQCIYPELKISIFEANPWCQEGFNKWFKRAQPEVIIGVKKDVWQWVNALGLSIPDEIGFLHLDCRWEQDISGMHQNTESLGTTAVELLSNLVEGNITVDEERPSVVMLQSNFNEGKTLRPEQASP